MKNLKMICTTAFLMLALSVSSFGGEISTPGLVEQPGTPGSNQPVPDPQNPELPKNDKTIVEELGASGLNAVLITVAALF